jgi:hypothetical protein
LKEHAPLGFFVGTSYEEYYISEYSSEHCLERSEIFRGNSRKNIQKIFRIFKEYSGNMI